MFFVAAGTEEQRILVQIDDALDGTGVRVEGMRDGTLYCRIEDMHKPIGELRDTVLTRLRALNEPVQERIQRVYLQS